MTKITKRSELVERLHKTVSDNLKVSAAPFIKTDGTIAAAARLDIGDIEDEFIKIADELGLEQDEVVGPDAPAIVEDPAEGTESDAKN